MRVRVESTLLVVAIGCLGLLCLPASDLATIVGQVEGGRKWLNFRRV